MPKGRKFPTLEVLSGGGNAAEVDGFFKPLRPIDDWTAERI
jgi:hypothetical protein